MIARAELASVAGPVRYVTRVDDHEPFEIAFDPLTLLPVGLELGARPRGTGTGAAKVRRERVRTGRWPAVVTAAHC